MKGNCEQDSNVRRNELIELYFNLKLELNISDRKSQYWFLATIYILVPIQIINKSDKSEVQRERERESVPK